MAGAAPEGSGHQAGSEVAHPRPCWRRERKLPEGLGETRPKLPGPGKLLCIEAGRTGEEPKSHVTSGIPPTEPQVLLGDCEKRSDPLWASSPPL